MFIPVYKNYKIVKSNMWGDCVGTIIIKLPKVPNISTYEISIHIIDEMVTHTWTYYYKCITVQALVTLTNPHSRNSQ